MRSAFLFVALVCCATTVRGQDPPRLAFGLGAAVPLGQFDKYVGVGGQLDGSFLFNPVKHNDRFALRFDVEYVIYGSETQQVPLLNTQRVLVDVTTNNNIVSLGVGPQYTFAGRAIRPYIGGHVGFSYFFTESVARGSSSFGQPFASTTNFDDFTFQSSAIGGAYISLSSHKPVSLDVSVRFQHNATVRYLHEGSIQEQPDGSITFTPTETPVDLLLLRVGVAFGTRL